MKFVVRSNAASGAAVFYDTSAATNRFLPFSPEQYTYSTCKPHDLVHLSGYQCGKILLLTNLRVFVHDLLVVDENVLLMYKRPIDCGHMGITNILVVHCCMIR